jgi:hypothetical protein
MPPGELTGCKFFRRHNADELAGLQGLVEIGTLDKEYRPQGAKNRLRKKAFDQAKIPKSMPPGLKPTLIPLAFCQG